MSGALVLQRGPLTQQPQQGVPLDWANPITRGLQIALNFANPAQSLIPNAPQIVTNTATRGATMQGVTGNVTGPSNYVGFASSSIFVQNAWTSLSVVSFPSIVNAAISSCASAPGSGTTDRMLFVNASGQLQAYVYDGNVQNATDPAGLVANTSYVVAASETGSQLQLWKNGAMVAAQATANGGYTNGGTYQHFLGYGDGQGHAPNTSNARFALHLFWTRTLTPAEHASIAANPWQLFQAPRRRLWLAVNNSASPAVLLGAASTQANTSGTGAASQTHVLAGTSSSQANVSSTGTETQTHVLAGSTSSQANASGTGAVSQTQALGGAASTQANASGTGATGQTHVLTGSTSTQANVSGTGTEAQTHVLAGSTSSQANSASAAAVTQTQVLAGAASTQANSSGTGALVTSGALQGAASAQANTSGTGAVGQTHKLAGAASTQANVSGVGTETQTHVLGGSTSSQANVSGVGGIGQTAPVILAGSTSSQINVSGVGAVRVGTIPLASIASPERTWRVEGESRVWAIEGENLIWSIGK